MAATAAGRLVCEGTNEVERYQCDTPTAVVTSSAFDDTSLNLHEAASYVEAQSCHSLHSIRSTPAQMAIEWHSVSAVSI
jgi:hypothetical protein